MVSEVCLLVDKLSPGDCRKRSVRNDESIGKGNTYMWVSVKWKTEVKTDGPPCLGYNGLNGELEHLKIETRLRDESLGCVMVECVCLHKSSIFNVIRSPAGLTRMWPTLDLICEENDIQRQSRTGDWSENQTEDLDRHVSVYPSGPHNFFYKWLLKLIHSCTTESSGWFPGVVLRSLRICLLLRVWFFDRFSCLLLRVKGRGK